MFINFCGALYRVSGMDGQDQKEDGGHDPPTATKPNLDRLITMQKVNRTENPTERVFAGAMFFVVLFVLLKASIAAFDI